jgi:hypothetical protein
MVVCSFGYLFTGEGAIILVVPSFSPFSIFEVIRFMLFDPSSKEREEMDERKEIPRRKTQRNNNNYHYHWKFLRQYLTV